MLLTKKLILEMLYGKRLSNKNKKRIKEALRNVMITENAWEGK